MVRQNVRSNPPNNTVRLRRTWRPRFIHRSLETVRNWPAASLYIPKRRHLHGRSTACDCSQHGSSNFLEAELSVFLGFKIADLDKD